MHVFGILPTGSGKTLCFACLPFIFEQILEGEESIVTPLVKTKLGKNFTFPAGAPDPKYCLVDMFMGCTDPLVKEAIITGFTKDSSL